MGKTIRASALVLLLACSASAGIMGNDTPQPPPTPVPQSAAVIIQNDSSQPSVQETTTEGQGTDAGDESATPLLVQFALSLLALF
jgi:hypothetical protein